MTKVQVNSDNKVYISNNKALLAQEGGVTPTGNINITDTNVTDVTNYATAQVVDADLVAGNIKKDVSILGVVGTLEEGITPSGTKSITANGTYDVTNYASADVNVSGGGGTQYITREVVNGKLQMPTSSFTYTLPSDVTDVGNYALYAAFYTCKTLTSVDLSSLTNVSYNSAIRNAFYLCSKLTSVDLSNLETVSGSQGFADAFYFCTSLTSIDLSNLTTVSGGFVFQSAFEYCTSLTSVDFSSLTTISGNYEFYYAFRGCTKLTDVYFRALTTSSFGSYTNQFSSMLSSTGSTVTHTLHFPSNMETTISTLDGYPTFGGTSGYVTLAYDLPATS